MKDRQQQGKNSERLNALNGSAKTIHPDFAGVIDDTVLLRNRYAPQSKISVLTNATMLHRQEVTDALKKTDLPILKLDSSFDTTINLLNQPAKKIQASKLTEQLQNFGKQCIVQTMFVQGTYQGQIVDNTTEEELLGWERAILAIRPAQVMIYTIARNTPIDTLCKVPREVLHKIARRIEKYGLPAQVSE